MEKSWAKNSMDNMGRGTLLFIFKFALVADFNETRSPFAKLAVKRNQV